MEIRKGQIPGSRRNMRGYILTYPRLLKTKPLTVLDSQQRVRGGGLINFCVHKDLLQES